MVLDDSMLQVNLLNTSITMVGYEFVDKEFSGLHVIISMDATIYSLVVCIPHVYSLCVSTYRRVRPDCLDQKE